MCWDVCTYFLPYLRISTWGGGRGGFQWIATQPAYAVFHFGNAKIEVFGTYFSDTVIT